MATSSVANPYYDDPFLTQAASNIAKIFVDPNPGQTAVHRAQADYYNAETGQIQRKAAAGSKIGAIFTGANGRQLTPQEYATITGAGLEGGIDPKQYQEGNLFYVSNSGQPDTAIGRAFVGTGKLIGKDQGVSVGDRNAIAQRDNDAAAQRASISAGPGYAAVAENKRYHDAEIDFKNKTRFDKPVTVNEGDAVYPSADDPRLKSVTPGSVPNPKVTADRFVQSEDPEHPGHSIWRKVTDGIAGPPVKSTADHYVASPDANSPTGWSQKEAGVGVPVAPPAPAVKPPMTVNPDTLTAIEGNALASVGAADPANKYAIDPEFASMFKGQLPVAQAAASKVYQQTHDAAQAQAAYLRALGIQPGSKWESRGWYNPRPSAFDKPTVSPITSAVTGGSNAQPAPQAAPPAAAALPPEAASRLRAGVNTKFGNGQVWTIQNGVPTRVQ